MRCLRCYVSVRSSLFKNKQTLSTATRGPLLGDGTTGLGDNSRGPTDTQAHHMSAAWLAARPARILGPAPLLVGTNALDWK